MSVWEIHTDGNGRHGTGHGVGHFLNVHEGTGSSYIICFVVFANSSTLFSHKGPQGLGTRIGMKLLTHLHLAIHPDNILLSPM